MHNKEYALKLVQEKINGNMISWNNNYYQILDKGNSIKQTKLNIVVSNIFLHTRSSSFSNFPNSSQAQVLSHLKTLYQNLKYNIIQIIDTSRQKQH